MTNEHKYDFQTAVVRLLCAAALTAYLCLMAWLLSGCERREMYVYGDNFESVELEVDWRQYAESDPGGMTAWFYPLGNDAGSVPYRITTASVNRQSLYLPGGQYRGVVIDYSPEEYSDQRFVDLNDMAKARVVAKPARYQPDINTISGDGITAGMNDSINNILYSDEAWTDRQAERSEVRPETGLYTLSSQPEEMALDTLQRVLISSSQYGDYVPYKERDTFQSTITMTTIKSVPQSLIWKVRARIYVADGFNSLWKVPATITGLSNGHYLATDTNTDEPCLLPIDDWSFQRTGENSGYISCTFTTFGLRPGSVKRNAGQRVATRAEDDGWYDYDTNLLDREDLRLNLAFILRDHSTVVDWHLNVGDQVVSFEEQLVLRVDLGPEYFDPTNPDGGGVDIKPIVLPYVEAYDGAGFDANVSPWQEGGNADVTM